MHTKLVFCVVCFVILVALFVPTLVVILKASQFVAKGRLASILSVTTLITGAIVVYTIVSCARFYDCSPVILLIGAVVLQTIVCSLLMYAVKRVEKKHQEFNEAVKKYEAATSMPVANAVAAEEAIKALPACPKVDKLLEPSADYLGCLGSGFVHVDGKCTNPQQYGIDIATDYNKRCKISCGQNYVYQEHPLC